MRRATLRRNSFIASALAVGAFGTPRASSGAESVVLRCGHAQPDTDPFQLGGLHFGELVSRRTSGAVRIEMFPNNQLGNQQALMDGLGSGVVDLAIVNNAFIEGFAKNTQVFDLPFIFRSAGAAERTLDGPIGQRVLNDLPSRGIYGLAWYWAGWREMENNIRPIVRPSDCAGLRMRIQNGAVYVAMFKALGAIPIPIVAAEAYVALTQHVVDGLEYPLPAFVDAKYIDVVKYVSLTNHTYNAVGLLGSKRKIDGLDPAQRRAVFDSAKESAAYMRVLVARAQTAAIDLMVKKGLVVTKDVDHDAFARAMTPIYDQFKPQLDAGLLDDVVRAGQGSY